MNYIENTYVCLAAPLLLAILCLRKTARRLLIFLLAGMTACLCSAYVSAYLAGVTGTEAVTATYEIVPVVEEAMKFLPLLFYLSVQKLEEVDPFRLFLFGYFVGIFGLILRLSLNIINFYFLFLYLIK